ncbi:Gliding motility-associated, C-terminal domain [Flavobacteriaceae bacterium]
MKKITLLLLTLLLSVSGISQTLQEGFEGATFPPTTPAPGWVVFQNTFGNRLWGASTVAHTGTGAAQMNCRQGIGDTNTSKDFLVTPLVTIPANGQLRFWTKTLANGNQNALFQIRVASGANVANQTDPAAFNVAPANLIQEWADDQICLVYNEYEEKVINFPPALIGTAVYIAFVNEYTQLSGTDGDTWYVDDVLLISRCLEPTALPTNPILSTSATLNWGNPNLPINGNPCTQWEVEVIPASQPTPSGTGVPVTTNPTYTATTLTAAPFAPLLPLTQYKYYVRSICSFSNSEWVGPFTFTTTAAPPVCDGNYVDSGGIANDYSDDETAAMTTQVICPNNPGDLVTVTFTSFATERNFDFLKIYDGNVVSAATLLGNFSGTLNLGSFTASSASGCLTFVFTSDFLGTDTGWTSNITCAPRPTCTKPNTLLTSAVTASSVTLNWTQPANPDTTFATAWECIALPCGTLAPTAASTGWVTATAPPFIMTTGLLPGTCYDFYVRAVCSGSDSSAWSAPKSATTMPGCGGPFTDPGGSGNYADNITAANGTYTICPNNPGDVVTVTFTSFATEPGYDFLKVYDGVVSLATQLGNFSGVTIPGQVTATSSTGCLVFVFTSDTGISAAGWNASVTCAPPPTCSKPKTLTVSQVTQSTALLAWVQPANPNGSFATAWQVIALPCGSLAPTGSTTGWVNATSNPFYLTGLNPATCYEYYVRAVCSATDTSFISGPKGFNTLIANDECVGAITVPVNQNTNCLQTVRGSLAFATASPVANSCGATASTADNDDVWFSFTATAINHYISLLGVNYADTPTGLNYAIYSGSCGTLTQIGGCRLNSSNPPNPTLNGLTIGTTYYIRVYSTGTAAVTTTFEVCIGTNVGSCPTAIPLCAIQPIIIPNNVGVPTLPNPISPFSTTNAAVGCLGSAPSPTFYYLQIPTNGNYNFFLEQNSSIDFTGTGIDVDFVAWGPYATNAAACAGITTGNAPPTGIRCSYSTDFTENFGVNNAIAGQIYVVMITNYNGRKGFVRITQTTGPIPTVCCPFGNFTYSSTFYCQNGANPSPSFVSNATAGTFSAVPATGLSIDPITGLINLASSTPGTYVVHNIIASSGTCPSDDDSWTITITAPPSTTGISYSSLSYCKTNTTPQTVTQTGTTGGTYTIVPATGLTLITSTGAFTPRTSSVGNYVVTYNLPPSGGCLGASSSANVSIVDLPIATFSYDAVTYCKNGNNPILTQPTGASAGVFSSAIGLSLDATTGAINLTNSLSGLYTITNTIAALGGCPETIATFNIEITAPPVAAFNYGILPYCQNASNPLPSFGVGGVAGAFSSSSLLLIVNAITGEVDLANSIPGNYTVTNTIAAANGCAIVSDIATITITALPIATFDYPLGSYCTSGTNPSPTFIGLGVAGVFSSAPAGLSISSSGLITLSTSTAENYIITNTIAAANGCGVVVETFPITIINPQVATFNYPASPYCQNATNPNPSFVGTGEAGVFSSSSPLLIVNSVTGIVDLANSTPGTYTVTNTIAAANGCAIVTHQTPITITITPQATITYDSAVYCHNSVVAPVLTQTGTLGGTYSSTPSGLTLNSTTGAISLSSSLGGAYIISYTVLASGGCSQIVANASTTIIPEVAVILDAECDGPIFKITALPIANSFDPINATYEWAGPNGFTFGPSTNPSVSVPLSGTYTSIVTYNGCENRTNQLVNSVACTMQKGISPNGDGDNEAFLLADVKSISIYNRYGSKVYSHGANYTNEWHGQSNSGSELPDGTYYYVINRNSGETITGWIYINR